ncbi:MAG: glucose-6-phosphate isomerase family protein [Candidatus Anstonellaceae archaeon]
MAPSWEFEGDSLVFDGKKAAAPTVRTFEEMRPVLADAGVQCSLQPDSPLYYMFRAVLSFQHIRYDITRILSADLCGEYNKTFGHIHPPSKSGASWPEVYEVLDGDAHFLLQKVSSLGVQDAILLSAKKGERFLVPPAYGHVTINPGRKDLVLANLISGDFQSDYSMFANRKGACFYEMKGGKIVKNPNYGKDFEVRKVGAVKFSESFGCFAPFKKLSLLEAAQDYRNIEFLQKPEMFY